MKTHKRLMDARTGKLGFEFEELTARARAGDERAVYAITREQIEQRDIMEFLGTFSPQTDPTTLRGMLGKVTFAVDGYDERPEPLCAIPEARAYFRQCHRWMPCWTFFSDLESDSLAMVACCLMNNAAITQRADHLVATMRLRELAAFLRSCQPTDAYIHELADIRKPQQEARFAAISSDLLF